MFCPTLICVRAQTELVKIPALRHAKGAATAGKAVFGVHCLKLPHDSQEFAQTSSNNANRLIFVLVARIPTAGVAMFQTYEDSVLPLLSEFGGRLDGRFRNSDGTTEVHIVSFSSEVDFEKFRADPRRAAQAPLLEESSAKLELLSKKNVS